MSSSFKDGPQRAAYPADVNSLVHDIVVRVGDPVMAYQAVARVAANLRPSGLKGVIRTAADVWQHPRVRRILRAKQEHFLALLLDTRHRVLRTVTVAIGCLAGVEAHPREVFRPAIRYAAAVVLAVHNHPSGVPEPSVDDLEITERLREAGNLLGIPLLDHVVVGTEGYVSLAERGVLGA